MSKEDDKNYQLLSNLVAAKVDEVLENFKLSGDWRALPELVKIAFTRAFFRGVAEGAGMVGLYTANNSAKVVSGAVVMEVTSRLELYETVESIEALSDMVETKRKSETN